MPPGRTERDADGRRERMAKSVEELEREIKAYVLGEFLPGEDPDELKLDTPLISSGVLDSIAAIRVVEFLEESYGIEFEAAEISADYLDTVAQIAQFVSAKVSAGE